MALVAFLALVLSRATLPLIDGDVWWHLRAGDAVLLGHGVPRADTWTLVGQGLPWISQDWLSNTLMAAVDRAGATWGPTLLSLGFGLATAAAFALLAAGLRRRGATGWLGTIGWLTFGLVVAGPVIGVRVQTLDLLLAAAVVFALWSYLVDRRARWLVSLPLLAVAWVNLHAGFPLLFLLGAGVIAGEGLDRLTGRRPPVSTLTPRQLTWLAGALLVAGGALLLNPNGAAIYGYPFATASLGAHRDFIFEWSRPDLSTFPGQAFFALLAIGVIPTLLVARRSMPAADALWLLGLTALALTAIRFVLVLGPIGAALCALHLGPRVARTRLGRSSRAVLERMSLPPRGVARHVNAALAVLMVAGGIGIGLARSAPPVQAAAIREAMPVAATAWLAGQHPRRIFNVYAWGGYIGREIPSALVYIDGRSDIFGDTPIRAYARAIGLQTDPGLLLDAYAVDHVVFWPDSPLGRWLDRAPAWRRVYTDSLAAVWARR